MNGMDFMVQAMCGGGHVKSPRPAKAGEKLTDAHISYVRSVAGVISITALALKYGVSRGTILNIQNGRCGAGCLVRPLGQPVQRISE